MSAWAESEEKDDLGLRLSLSSSEAVRPIQLNLMPPASPPLPFHSNLAVAERRTEMEQRPLMLRGIDVNRVPVAEWEVEDDPGGSSPNSTVSSASAGMKRGFDASAARAGGEVVEVERECSPRGASDEEDGDGSRKKLRLSKDQSAILEESFKEHNTLNPKQKMALAKQLNLRPRQVEVWFQNRRARTKLKQTEVDCEFLKRCCENLTEENRRLQKEVQELRALKLSPQFYMHMTPPTTLTMCPSCERVAVANPAAASTAHVGTPSAASTAPPGETRLFPQPLHAAAASTPWAPIPLRHSFLDVPPQRP